MNTIPFSITTTVLALLPTIDLRAQALPSVQASPISATTTHQPVATAEGDALLAMCIQTASDHAIALAQIAKHRAQSPAVRAYAQKVIDDHSAFAAQLLALGAKATAPLNVDAAVSPKATPPAFDHAALWRDLGKSFAATASKQLDDTGSAAFDHTYLQMQMAIHSQEADAMSVFGKYVAAPLRPLLETGRKTMLFHLEQARAICNKLDHEVKVGVDRDRR